MFKSMYETYTFILLFPFVIELTSIIAKILTTMFGITTVSLAEEKQAQNTKTKQEIPFFSIIIPVHNSSKTIERTLDSILTQNIDYKNYEILLVDNASTDNSAEICKNYIAQHELNLIKYLYTDDPGKSKAINFALTEATGEYTVSLDSDVYLAPNSLQFLLKDTMAYKLSSATILINTNSIRNETSPFIKLLQICEHIEYIVSFYMGRVFYSLTNTLITNSGGCLCVPTDYFKSIHGYNVDNICEDMELTINSRKDNIYPISSTNSIVFTDGIEDSYKLSTQRQRWTAGAIGTTCNFLRNKHKVDITYINYLTNLLAIAIFPIFEVATLMSLPVLALLGFYDLIFIAKAYVVLYIFYIVVSLLLYLMSKVLLMRTVKHEMKHYVNNNTRLNIIELLVGMFIFPLYNLVIKIFSIKKSIFSSDNNIGW